MISIRLATPMDALGIVNIVRAGFTRDVIATTIYGCRGIETFIQSQLALPPKLSESVYYVAEVSHCVVSLLEFKIFENEIFLNYIGVSPKYRGQSFGQELFGEAFFDARKREHRTISLDVFDDNSVAKDWYITLGFEPIYDSLCYSVAQSSKHASSQSRVTGLAQARVCHDTFGFSQFTVHSGSGSYSVGLLGDLWFRLTQASILKDSSALACLWEIDPRRKLLCVVRESENADLREGADCIYRSIRFAVDSSRFETKILAKMS